MHTVVCVGSWVDMAIDSVCSEVVDAPSEEAMKQLVLVCLGSAVGGGARYLLSGWASRTVGSTFPFGTLADWLDSRSPRRELSRAYLTKLMEVSRKRCAKL